MIRSLLAWFVAFILVSNAAAQVQVEIDARGSAPLVKVHGGIRERMAQAGVGSILLTTAFTRHYATATAIALRAGVG